MSTHHPTSMLVRRRPSGDVHFGSMAGDVRPAPRSGSPEGDHTIAELMRGVLDQVRRHLAERGARPAR